MTEPTAAPDAAAICRGAIRHLHDLGFASVTELTLANGRRADIVGLGPDGELFIVEVKSGLADYRSDSKWQDYLPFCDRFAFAVSSAFPHQVIPGGTGLIIADAFGGALVREPATHKLAAARRKAMMLRFARLAASRLQGRALAPLDARPASA